MATLLSIREAARVSGLPAETIRYYERIGVLPPVPRAANGYRCYTVSHIETLRFARSMRELGLRLASLAALVRLFHDGTCADMQDALGATIGDALARLRAQRDELERTEARLRALAGAIHDVTADGRPSGGLQPCSCVAAVERDASSSPDPMNRFRRLPAVAANAGSSNQVTR